MSKQTYFGTSDQKTGPLDAMHDAAAVVHMLESFLIVSHDLSNFVSEVEFPNNQSMRGLTVVLQSVRETIMRSTEALEAERIQHRADVPQR